jgi:hypothetical protein
MILLLSLPPAHVFHLEDEVANDVGIVTIQLWWYSRKCMMNCIMEGRGIIPPHAPSPTHLEFDIVYDLKKIKEETECPEFA